MNVWHQWVGDWVQRGLGDLPAVRFAGRTTTYAGLADLSARAAGLLRRRGVGPGDRVLLACSDALDALAAVLGALRRGAISILANPLSPRSDLEELAALSSPRLLVAAAPAAVESLPAGVPAMALGGLGGLEPVELSAEEPDAGVALAGPGDDAVWQPTLTEDGRTYLVRHPHRALAAGASPFAVGRLEMTRQDRCLSVAKLCFGYGFGGSAAFPLATGACSILHPGRSDVASLMELVEQERPTLFFGVPTFYSMMLRVPELRARWDLRSVRLWISAGEALAPDLARRCEDVLERPLVDGFGSTEMFHVFLSEVPGERGLRATPGHQLKVIDGAGREVADGEAGMLLARGPHCGTGYAGEAEASREVFLDGGWVRVGDRFRRRPDGLFVWEGRGDELVKVGGQKVSPRQLAAEARGYPGAVSASVRVEPAEDGRTELRLVMTFEQGRAPDPAEVRRWVRGRVLPHKVPRYIEVRS